VFQRHAALGTREGIHGCWHANWRTTTPMGANLCSAASIFASRGHFRTSANQVSAELTHACSGALESYFRMSPSACAEKPLPAKGECARYGYGLGIMKDEADPMGWGKNGHRRWSGVPQSLVFSPERLTGPFPYNAAIESVLFENGCDPLAMWSTQVGKATCMHTDVWVDTGQGKCSHDWGTVAAPVGKCSGAAPHTIGYLHLFTHDYFGFNVQMKDSQVHWESHTSDHPLKSTNGQYWSEAVRNKESQFFSSPQVTQLTPLQHTYNIHTYIQCHTMYIHT
jgi:hypothetical protein